MLITRRFALQFLGTGLGVGLAATAGSGGVLARMPEGSPGRGQAAFISGGRAIGIERFEGAGDGRRAAVILLHGSDGPGPRYRAAARQVARGGYTVFLVHYLDRTGERRASLSSIIRNFRPWIETTRDAVSFVATQPGVDPARIGVLGVSLGGGLGIALAAQDRRVRALVDHYGFLPDDLGASPVLPPTLILHGEADRVVPVANAQALERLLQARGIPHEVRIYPGQGHGFTGEAEADAARRIRTFFARTLQG